MSILYTIETRTRTMRIDKVKWITAHSCGKLKWHSFTSSLKLKREKFGASTLSHKMCPRKQTTEPKQLLHPQFFWATLYNRLIGLLVRGVNLNLWICSCVPVCNLGSFIHASNNFSRMINRLSLGYTDIVMA